jgi:UDP-N-acetylmuramate dehydrogenase
MSQGSRPASVEAIRKAFGDRLREKVPLAAYTSARIGGPAEFLLEAHSADDLSELALLLWNAEMPFHVLGGGSNVLIADAGMQGVVVLNQARAVSFDAQLDDPSVTAESGTALGTVARRSVERGLAGLEWATTIPGTVGGGIVGNAGAHGSDVAGSLIMAEILQHDSGNEQWSAERLEYTYRDSWLKRNPGAAVVLSATFRLQQSTKEQTKARASEFALFRTQTQPRGASWGSMFKNPPGDHAGRLIEAAGLKGFIQGKVQISPQHANFFINLGEASADDAWHLIQVARQAVAKQFSIELELEVELLGNWEAKSDDAEGGQP